MTNCCKDPALQISNRLFKDIQQTTGAAYLFMSHDLAVVRHLSHRVAVIYHGEFVDHWRSRRNRKPSSPNIHAATQRCATQKIHTDED